MVAKLPWSALLGRRYRRLGVIGRGATGTVYRAVDRLNGRRVALKTFTADTIPPRNSRGLHWRLSPETPELLEREFKLLASLHHPNIIATLDYGRDHLIGPFFTMDLQDDSCTIREAAAEASVG